MFFLLRMAFWLGLVVILLPAGAAQHAGNDVKASEAISAASATVGDMRGFCTRQPDACTVGSHMATAIGYKAQAGAKMLYDVLSEAMAPREGASPTATMPSRHVAGAKPVPEKAAVERTSQSTLTPTDLAPSWRGPLPRKDGKHPA
jgi:hypothetical protein